jgi:hypothetical protein
MTHHSSSIAIRSEQSQLSIPPSVHLHSLETLSGVMEARSSRSKRKISIRSQLWCRPSNTGFPDCSHHVIGTLGSSCDNWISWRWNSHRILGSGEYEFGCIERCECGLGLDAIGFCNFWSSLSDLPSYCLGGELRCFLNSMGVWRCDC